MHIYTNARKLFTAETIILIRWLINAEFHFITTKIPNNTAGGLSCRSPIRRSKQQDITTTNRVRVQGVYSATCTHTRVLNTHTYICM